MLEITGNIFYPSTYSLSPNKKRLILCITTNGIVKTNGKAVMGAGIAKEFASRYPQLPDILGAKLTQSNNRVHELITLEEWDILSFPTKHHWRDKSDLNLIVQSATQLGDWCKANPEALFILPRPGCGCGSLNWYLVKNAIAPILPDNCWIISR